nr:serine/threonine-protein kinase mph1 isoform X1 [Ipomoea batatas]
MEREANLPVPPAAATSGVPVRPINPDSAKLTRSSNSSSSSSPPDFLRDVQAAFKRHRPLGNIQSNNIRPRRQLLPRREVSNSSTKSVDPMCDMKKAHDDILASHRLQGCISQPKNIASVVRETHEDESVTPPSDWNSTVNTHEQDFRSMNAQRDQIRSFEGCQSNITLESTVARSVDIPLVEGQKKVHYAADYNSRSQGADGQMATQRDDLLSHMNSLALTGTEWYTSSQIDAPTVVSQDMRNQNVPHSDMDGNLRSEAGISLLDKRTAAVSDQPHQFSNFLQSDFSHPMTQSSVNGSSCITTTLINSTSAPMLNSTTYCSQSHKMGNSHLVGELIGESKLNYELVPQKDIMQLLHPSSKNENVALAGQEALTALNSSTETKLEAKSSIPSKEQHSTIPKLGDTSNGPSPLDGNSAKGDVADMQSEDALPKVSSLGLKAEPSKLEKPEKVASSKVTSSSRRKTYDPDLFFKVNGKLYQRLGKIGSGGSSEVHKVISSDCTIYALKRIKLKGRDHATAYGFCQEIEYLKTLKGKNNIIQLIDYEVTDKNLLQEVMNGSMSNKDGRVKEDGFIYMVLEYGEIDLAHMLSQKWRELDDCNATIDENWLRFYWQQVLLAVNTIHEERIVHSDLKPANFLLVRGSLKLIDFGIAKAIMSDTTNIQRDAQVGTLSYMSPEAFLCNETDANGNIIKCGRPSDIWSLGCILYQMVYGRTPFSEHRTFWAKFKVITDPNHEITYEPVSNPWLLDLMKKCLAWDRNERWRIPELLQHPFLVPPVPTQPSFPQEHSCKLVQLLMKSCQHDQDALMLCSQLQQLLADPRASKQSESTTSQQCELLFELSKLCLKLRVQLATLGSK